MKKIPLTQNRYAIVDDADYELVAQYKWTFADSNRGGRAVRFQWVGTKETTIAMHQFVSGIYDRTLKHLNGDGLDNRRENLAALPPRSRYKGVYRKAGDKWEPSMLHEGKRIGFGHYKTQREAHIAFEIGRKLIGTMPQKDLRKLCYLAAARPVGLRPLTIKQLLKSAF